MAVYVGQGFLHDAEYGDLQIPREATQRFWNFQVDLNLTAFGETGGEPSQGRSQSNLIQHGRMEKIGESTNFLESFVGEMHAFRQELRIQGASSVKLALQYGEIHGDADEKLT